MIPSRTPEGALLMLHPAPLATDRRTTPACMTMPQPVPLLVLCLVALALRFAFGPNLADDAYITLRYARNAAHGLGLVYNPGEPVLGVTTPLWLLLTTVAAFLHWHLPTFAFLAGAFLDSLVPPLLFLIGRRLGWSPLFATLPALAYAINPFAVTIATSGMETGLFLALLTTSAWATLAQRPRLALATASLAALTRPEGFVLLASLIAYDLWTHRRLRWPTLAIPSVLIAPWIAFATLAYGSPIPVSMLAKVTVYQHLSFASQMALHFLGFVTFGLPLFLPTVLLDSAHRWLFALATLLLPGLALLRQPGLRPLLLFHTTLGLAFAAAVLSGRLLFWWYLVPLLPMALLGTASALRLRAFPHASIVAVSVVLLGSPLFSWIPHSKAFAAFTAARVGREAAYWQVVQLLQPQVTPATTIAANEIGVLDFGLPARVLDTIGLVSPQSRPYHRGLGAGQEVPLSLIQDRLPDYIVAHEVYAVRSWGDLSQVAPLYELIAEFPAPPMGNYARILVFKRRP